MSFHFVSHSWEVSNLYDGIMVTVSQQELEPHTIAVLVDELFELVRESGQPHLYLDLGKVRFLASMVTDKLITLDDMMRHMDCRLILCNLDPLILQTLQATPVLERLIAHSLPETVNS
jgi:anti-anti-sigma regulatory factor